MGSIAYALGTFIFICKYRGQWIFSSLSYDAGFVDDADRIRPPWGLQPYLRMKGFFVNVISKSGISAETEMPPKLCLAPSTGVDAACMWEVSRLWGSRTSAR